MAPAVEAVAALSSVRAGSGNAARFPARAGRCHKGRLHPCNGRPAPDPAGAKRPPGAGRALAGGFGPRLATGKCGAVAGAMAPAIAAEIVLSPVRAGPGNAARFPRPRATVPCRPADPGPAEGQRPTRRGRSARRWRGGRWPGALAPGWSRGSVALWQGRWPLPLKRWQRFHQFGREQETRPAFPPPVRHGSP